MPQIRTRSISLAVVFSLLVLALSGCGDANPQANLDSTSGKHVANWLYEGHLAAAQADLNGCTDCHGTDLDGGIAKVSCLQCHIGSTTAAHPVLWGQLGYALHSGFVATNGNTSCATAVCHGTDLLGVTGGGRSCAVSCHMAGTAQAPQIHQWGNAAATTGEDIDGHDEFFHSASSISFATCRNSACHGTNLQGAFASGPSCVRSGCHGSGNPLPAEN